MSLTVSLVLTASIFVWRLLAAGASHHNRCPESCSSCTDFLHCYKNNWTVIPDSLTHLVLETRITRVVIRNTYLTTPGMTFANVSSLLELVLSRNSIDTLDGDAFVGLWNLKILDLSGNNLRDLDAATFRDLSSLEQLMLRGNLLTQIAGSKFGSLGSLVTLDLSGNYLEVINTWSFKGLQNLQELFLQGNDLTYIDRLWFGSTGSLNNLILSNNKIEHIPEYAFTYLRNLTVLEIKNCDVASTDVTTFDGLHNLHTLHLSGNSFSKFPVLQVKDLGQLNYLAIGGAFRVIPEYSLKDFWHLEVLLIEKCRHLTRIPSDSFINLSSLKKVHIQHNRHLTRLEPGAFRNTSTPTDVSLRDNKLRSLSASLFHWDKVDSISLGDNPWHCNCSLKWLRDLGRGNVVCATPRPVAGQYFNHVTNLTCKVEVVHPTPTGKTPPTGHKTDWGLTPYQIGLIVGVCTVLILTLIVTTLVLKDGTPGTRTTRGRPIHIDHHMED